MPSSATPLHPYRAWPTLVVWAVATTACNRSIDNPTAPDQTALEAIYLNPTGALSNATLDATATEYAQRVDVITDTGDLGVIGNALDQVSDQNTGVIDNSDQLDQSTRPKRLLTVKVRYVCRGPLGAEQTVDAERNGTMSMQLKASEHGLYPVAWGTFDRCSDHSERASFVIDGDYFVALQSAPEGFDRLFAFTGAIETLGLRYEGDLDFRRLADGATEVRVEGPDGDIVMGVDKDGRLLARDRVDQWLCDLTTPRCESMTTGEVVGPEEVMDTEP